MKCQRCDNESTGVLIHLCDDCFEWWSCEVKTDPSTADIAPIDPCLKYQSGGGLIPDNEPHVAVVTLDAEDGAAYLTVRPERVAGLMKSGEYNAASTRKDQQP